MIHVSRDLISKWENNKRRPDYQTLHNLENIFNVETNYFEPPNRALTDELAKCVPENNNIDPTDIPDILNSFLKNIPERDSNIFVKRYYFCKSTAEIAQEYKTSEAYIRVILSRTKKN